MLVVAIEYSYEYGIDNDILCNPIKSVCILFSNQKLINYIFQQFSLALIL